jgi:peptidoglycan-N-acetylglucosamine deacetylase
MTPPARASVIRRRATIAAAVLLAAAALPVGLWQLARSRSVQLFGDIVARVDTPDSVVALTFDDGPVASLTDSLVALLAQRDVRATFFMIGRELEASPASGRKLAAAGHELANHSYSHRRLVLVGAGMVREEVERTDSLIRAAGARGPIHFRPPYGKKLVALPLHLWRTGRTTIMCDVEPDSYADVAASADGIVAHVLARARPGSIILLHPWYPSRATSLAAVPGVIDGLRARGYRFVTVNELLSRRR